MTTDAADLLDTNAVLAELGLKDRSSISHYVRTGQLEVFKRLGRGQLFLRSEIERFKAEKASKDAAS